MEHAYFSYYWVHLPTGTTGQRTVSHAELVMFHSHLFVGQPKIEPLLKRWNLNPFWQYSLTPFIDWRFL